MNTLDELVAPARVSAVDGPLELAFDLPCRASRTWSSPLEVPIEPATAWLRA